MQNRRAALKSVGVLAGLLVSSGLFPQLAMAFNKNAFEAKTTAEALKSLGVGAMTESKDVSITAPDIAENGAVVPVSVATTASGVKSLLIMVEKNPSPLTTLFNITDSIEPAISARVKMGQTSDVYAVAVLNDGKLLFAKKEVKVTLGGCGG